VSRALIFVRVHFCMIGLLLRAQVLGHASPQAPTFWIKKECKHTSFLHPSTPVQCHLSQAPVFIGRVATPGRVTGTHIRSPMPCHPHPFRNGTCSPARSWASTHKLSHDFIWNIKGVMCRSVNFALLYPFDCPPVRVTFQEVHSGYRFSCRLDSAGPE
jgi:hypothetical protein